MEIRRYTYLKVMDRKFNSKVISPSWSFQKRFPTPAPVRQNLISKCQTRDRGTLSSKFVVTIHLSSYTYLYRHGFFRKKNKHLDRRMSKYLWYMTGIIDSQISNSKITSTIGSGFICFESYHCYIILVCT